MDQDMLFRTRRSGQPRSAWPHVWEDGPAEHGPQEWGGRHPSRPRTRALQALLGWKHPDDLRAGGIDDRQAITFVL